ncbi:MAG: superoxide dismutase family protein [Myxococcota bacterium]
MFTLLVLFACAHKQDTVSHNDPRPQPVENTVSHNDPRPQPVEVAGVAKLQAAADGKMGGAVAFTQSEKGLKVSINLTDASPGSHVVQLREGGSCTFPETTAGPQKFDDLATVTVGADGTGHADVTLTNLKLTEGDHPVVGRPVIVDSGAACGIVSAG